MFDSALSIGVLVVGILIIAVLVAVAIFLHWQLHLRKKRDAQLLAEQEARIAKMRQEAINSLRIIAKSYLSEQVELAEASIRISRVMDSLELNEAQRTPYRVFDQIHSQLAHIPILSDWKALSKKEKAAHLKTINQVEKEYQDFAKDAVKQLAKFEIVGATFYSA